MNITLTDCEGYVVAQLHGVLDESAKTGFDEQLHPVISSPGGRLLLDLSDSERITSAGVGLLVALVSRANTKGSYVVLARPTPFVGSILKVTKLTKFFQIEETVEEGIAFLQDPS